MLRSRRSLALMLAALASPVLAQPSDDASYRAATGLLHRGMPAEAAAEYRTFLHDQPSHAKADSARYGLAVCLVQLGQWKEAAKQLDGLPRLSSFEFAPDALLLRAQCHLSAQDEGGEGAGRDGAIRCLQDLLKSHPEFAQCDAAAALLGETLLRDGKPDEARAVLDRFERDWPKSAARPRAEYLLASLDAADGHDPEAAARLERLRKQDPNGEIVAQATLAEAQCRHRMAIASTLDPREAERASALYRAVADKGQKELTPEALLGLAQLTRASGDAPKAGRILDDLLARFPTESGAAARIERARAYLDEDKPDRALAALEPVLRKPTADAAYWAAKAELRLQRYSAAADRLVRAAEQNPDSKLLPEILFDRAVALAKDGKPADAAASYNQVRSRFPKHPLSAESLAAEASLALASGESDKAIDLSKEFLNANAKHPRAASMQLVLAEAYSAAGRNDEAADRYAAFVSASAQDPRAVDAAIRRGLALARAGKSDEATTVLDQALAAPGQLDESLRTSAQTVLADAAMTRSDWPGAEKWLRALTARRDAAPDALLKLGIALQRQGRADDSLELFRRVIEQSPTDPSAIQARFERAQVLVEQNKLDAAKADFEAVLAADKSSKPRFTVHCLRHLASIASRQNRAEDAAKLLAQVADSPDAGAAGADALYERGAALLAAGQYEEADEALAKFLSTSPSHPRAADGAAQQAIATSRLGHYEQALSRLEAADSSSVRPEVLAALRYERAWALKSLGRADDARAAYERLLSTPVAPSLESHACLDLAQLHIAANQHAAAAPLLARALTSAERLPADDAARVVPHSLYLRGVCELKLDKPSDAAATLEDLLSRFPKSDIVTTAQLLAGQALLKSNKPEAAAKRLESAIAGNPSPESLAPALLCLGEAHAASQQWDKSRAAFEQHQKQFPKSELWFQSQFGIAWALEHEGRAPEAISAYRDVVAKHNGPTAARAQFQIGECYFGQKQYDEAVRELMKVDILYAYPEWSAAALYEAGRCLVQLNKATEARTQFTQVTERFKDTQWARLAADQLQKVAPPASPSLPGRAASEAR